MRGKLVELFCSKEISFDVDKQSLQEDSGGMHKVVNTLALLLLRDKVFILNTNGPISLNVEK